MGFWQNVEEIREYKCISRKELAAAAVFSVNTISNGLKRDGSPDADLALRISKVLDTPLEELLGSKNQKKTKIDMNEFIRRQQLFTKYMPLIQKIDKLPANAKKALITIIDMM